MLSPSVFYLLRINHRNARDFDRFVSVLVASQTAPPAPRQPALQRKIRVRNLYGCQLGQFAGLYREHERPVERSWERLGVDW